MLGAEERQIRLEVESHFKANISEFGALDCILYNLINNACRHTCAGKIRLSILPLPKEQDLRFVLSNGVGSSDETRLAQRDLCELFKPGVSSTGSGFGMTVAADTWPTLTGSGRAKSPSKKLISGRG